MIEKFKSFAGWILLGLFLFGWVFWLFFPDVISRFKREPKVAPEKYAFVSSEIKNDPAWSTLSDDRKSAVDHFLLMNVDLGILFEDIRKEELALIQKHEKRPTFPGFDTFCIFHGKLTHLSTRN